MIKAISTRVYKNEHSLTWYGGGNDTTIIDIINNISIGIKINISKRGIGEIFIYGKLVRQIIQHDEKKSIFKRYSASECLMSGCQ